MAETGLLSHVDLRVRDRHRAKAFYLALLEPLGAVLEAEGAEWTSFVRADNPGGDWFAFTEDRAMSPGPGRVAFAARSRAEVDGVATLLAAIGARDIEGPGETYGPTYYAVFFTDPDGNKLEVCHIGDPSPADQPRAAMSAA